ncbi:MAG: MBL fold metallo-hydrolase [Myxococcales bacterium]|nr:MBL fold metallo-hydrolase [Myxococcales bacterium]
MAKPRHELRRRMAAVEFSLFAGAPGSAEEVEAHLGPLAAEVGGEAPARVKALGAIGAGRGDRAAYREQFGVCGVRRFTAASGVRIYFIPIETFPEHVNNLYLIVDGARTTLFDVGSQTAQTRDELARAAAVLRTEWGEPAAFDRVSDVVLSHGHIDHFGGVATWRERGARVHVHELDGRVVTGFEERIVVAAMQVRVFLERAGVSEADRVELEQMYVFTKHLFKSVPVDRLLVDGDEVNGMRAHHAPGHCPGQICLQVDNVLLTADHVLPRITPHQSPESITPYTGLGTYLESLERTHRLPGIDLALPGHEEPIPDLNRRIAEIVAFHRERLEKVRALCGESRTLADVAGELFGPQAGYGRLLALQEAGAHVEWLSQRGRLEIANLEDLTKSANPVVRYRASA